MANCASVATRSGHERRVNLYFELAWQPPRPECERNLNGRAGQAASRLPAPVRARAATRVRGVHARPHMLRLDGRLALVRGLLRPSSELSGAGSRGADQLVGRKFERNAAEPGQRGRGWDCERRSRSESPSDGKGQDALLLELHREGRL